MKKPVIGLTGSFRDEEWTAQHYLNDSYLDTIRHFGGIPLFIPVKASDEEAAYLVNQCDGLLLTGGDDLNPALFGEEILNDTVQIAAQRDRDEFRILDLAVKMGIPVFGICRGIQVMNVYFGGTLYQDIPAQIPSEVAHRMEKPYHRTSHLCMLVPGSPLYELAGKDVIGVNSHHHQAVKDPAPGFEVMGCSEDGLVEAIYDPSKRLCWGVQWHPERIWDIEDTSAALFRTFVESCRKK